MYFGWWEAIKSCTLAVLMGCRLSSVLFVCLFFSSRLLSFLSLLPLCRMLLRILCCLVITLWFSPISLLFLCFAKVFCNLHNSAACSSSSCLPVVVLHHCFLSFYFWGDLWRLSPVRWLAFSLILRDPLARHAFSHGSVLHLFTVLWLVSGSQSCLCATVSVSSVLWLVFRVDHVHKVPLLSDLIFSSMSKCHSEVMLSLNEVPDFFKGIAHAKILEFQSWTKVRSNPKQLNSCCSLFQMWIKK